MSEFVSETLKNTKSETFLLWFCVVASIFVIVAHAQGLFIRHTHDPKEFILYTSLGILIFLKLGSDFYYGKWQFQIKFLDLIFLSGFVYHGLQGFFVNQAPAESHLQLSQFGLTLIFVKVFSDIKVEWILKYIRILCEFSMVTLLIVLWSHFQVGEFSAGQNTNFLPIGHVSYFSDWALLVTPFLFYFGWWDGSKSSNSIIYKVGFVCFVMALCFAARRSSLLGAGFVVTLCGVLFYKLKKNHLIQFKSKNLMAVIVSVVIIFIGMQFVGDSSKNPSIIQRLKSNVTKLQQDGIESDVRTQIYLRTAKAVKQKPLMGWGYGQFKFVYPVLVEQGDSELRFFNKNAKWLMHPHNDIFFQLFEGGMIGFLLFYWGMLVLVYSVYKGMNSSKTPVLNAVLMSGMIGVFVSFQFNTASTNPIVRLCLLPYLLLAYQFVAGEFKKQSTQKYLMPAYMLITLMVLGFVSRNISHSMASYLLTKGYAEAVIDKKTDRHEMALVLEPKAYYSLTRAADIEVELGRPEVAIKHLEEAIELFPHVPSLIYRLVNTYLELGEQKKAKEMLDIGLAKYPFMDTLLELKNKNTSSN